LGTISGGYTILKIKINREGNLIDIIVLEHKGHKLLRYASINAAKKIFPLSPLPQKMESDTLVFQTILKYPKLKDN
jgi:outer membrane biosynthesis protein TonB